MSKLDKCALGLAAFLAMAGLIMAYVALVTRIPGPPGRDGFDGLTIAGPQGMPGLNGIGVEGAQISRNGRLEITLTDGRTLDVGRVIGNDGKDGAPGPIGPRGPAGPRGKSCE